MVKQIGIDSTTLFPIVEDSVNPGVALETLTGPAGTALAKGLLDNVHQRFNVLHFGLVGDRVTDNSAAFTTMMDHLRTLVIRPPVYFPAGFYLFSSLVKFDLPGMMVYGDGMGASFIVGDAGVEMNYPQPTMENIAITPEAATSVSSGLTLRNCWQATVTNVRIHNFLKCVHVVMDDEGEGLIPGNTPGGPYPITQTARHKTWPDLDEMVRDGLTTTEHWGSRVTIVALTNLHLKSQVPTGIGIHLENTLADPASSYDDFDSLSGSSGVGVFYTAVDINGGHFGCDGDNLVIGGGVHGVKINAPYMDSDLHGIRLEYGAQTVEMNMPSLDFGGQYAIYHEPGTVYSADDVVRISDRQYTCTTGGTSAANLNYNGVPNSEFVGAPETLKLAPLAEGNNGNDLFTQANVYGVKITSVDVQVFIEGLDIINGQRWLNMSTWLPAVTGSSETVNIWFGNPGRGLSMPAVSGNEIWARLEIQSRDPRTTNQPEVLARIRCANSAGTFTEQSAGIDVVALSGFSDGAIVAVNDTLTLADGTTASASPFIAITYGSSQSGLFQFRVSVPQINRGASLGAYVRTYGRRRARNQDGPSGTGTGISDGTCVWDYSGTPIATIIAPRQAWEVGASDTAPDIRFTGYHGTNQPIQEVNPLPHYFCATANPINSNGHPTTLPD